MASLTDFPKRLTTDDDLRQSLKANPEETLRREGVDLPEGVTVEVVESTPEKIYFAMPPKAEHGEDELSDRELAGATGGSGGDPALFGLLGWVRRTTRS